MSKEHYTKFEVDQILYNVAHTLKQKTTSIGGNLQLAQLSPNLEHAKARIGRALENLTELNQLLQNITNSNKEGSLNEENPEKDKVVQDLNSNVA